VFVHSDRDKKCPSTFTEYETVPVEELFIETEDGYEISNFCFLLNFQWAFY